MQNKVKAQKQNQGLLVRIVLFFFDHLKFSATLWISIFIFGFLSYTVFLQRQGFPQVNVPISLVQGVYIVDNKATVDSELTQPLLDSIKSVPSVKKTTATSTDNQTTIVIEYNDDITAAEGSAAVESAVNQNKADLPKTAQVNFQTIDASRFNNKYDILLSVSSTNSNVDINSKAEAIARDLSAQLPQAQSIAAIPQSAQGVNPTTGQTETTQTNFDWVGYRENDQTIFTNSVVIGVQTKENQDVIAFDNDLQQAIATVTNKPENKDVRVSVAAGFASSIRQQVGSLQRNLLEGLLIVIAVCVVFIGLRAGLLAAFGMLMTLTATVGTLYATGLTLNTITLFGLVLCLGLIVDDTVIMIEAIDAQRRKSKTARESVGVAVKKVALASAAGTFTTVLGFAPLLFVSGILGEFIRVLPITIIISLLFSLLISLLFVPFMARWFFKKPVPEKAHKFNVVRTFENWLGNTIGGLILAAKSRRRKIVQSFIAIVISLVFILGGVRIFSTLKFDIFPTTKDGDALQVQLTFAPATTFEQAQMISAQANEKISDALSENLERVTYQSSATNRSATANITLTSYEERDVTASELVSSLKTGLSDVPARVVVSQVSAGPPKEEFPFAVQIKAENTEQADQAANNLKTFLEGKTITRDNGTTAQIKEVSYTGEQATITRIDGDRVVEVAASFNAEDTTALVSATQKAVEDEFLNDTSKTAGLQADDFTFDFGNESQNQDSFKTVVTAFPMLLIAMFILLAIQFKSLLQPLLILVAVPFSFFGVAVALSLTDNPLSFFVMIGFFALIGISVNNSILLTDYANQSRRSGASPRQAMATAVSERIRPLLTTSITSVVALLPLALSDPFWESLAFTLIGGLLASTVLVVVSFPYYYLALEAIRSRAIKRLKRQS